MLHFRRVKVLTCRRDAGIYRRSQRLPFRGERWFYFAWPRVWFLMRWRAHRGYVMCAVCSAHDPEHAVVERWSFGDETMPIKKKVVSGELPPIPALSMESVIMKKCPLLMEFISATAYEDGSPRQPGYYTMRNRTIEYELTIYDPDAGMRCSIRSRDHDKCFLGAETILGTPDAPWELDKYLWEHRPKEKSKKK